jgi:hypothetical protein
MRRKMGWKIVTALAVVSIAAACYSQCSFISGSGGYTGPSQCSNTCTCPGWCTQTFGPTTFYCYTNAEEACCQCVLTTVYCNGVLCSGSACTDAGQVPSPNSYCGIKKVCIAEISPSGSSD